jgi:hypothetical protein
MLAIFLPSVSLPQDATLVVTEPSYLTVVAVAALMDVLHGHPHYRSTRKSVFKLNAFGPVVIRTTAAGAEAGQLIPEFDLVRVAPDVDLYECSYVLPQCMRALNCGDVEEFDTSTEPACQSQHARKSTNA